MDWTGTTDRDSLPRFTVLPLHWWARKGDPIRIADTRIAIIELTPFPKGEKDFYLRMSEGIPGTILRIPPLWHLSIPPVCPCDILHMLFAIPSQFVNEYVPSKKVRKAMNTCNDYEGIRWASSYCISYSLVAFPCFWFIAFVKFEIIIHFIKFSVATKHVRQPTNRATLHCSILAYGNA